MAGPTSRFSKWCHEQFRCQNSQRSEFHRVLRSAVKAHVVVRSERQTLNANTLEELPGFAVNLLPEQSPFIFLRAEIRGAAGAQHTTRARWPRCIEAYHHDIGQRHAGLIDGVLKTVGDLLGQIVGFYLKSPLEGYRRLDLHDDGADIVAISPSSVWRVWDKQDCQSKWKGKPSKKGTVSEHPLVAWYIDVSYINNVPIPTSGGRSINCQHFWLAAAGTSSTGIWAGVDDQSGCRDHLAAGQERSTRKRRRKSSPTNGPQFIAKEFIRISGMTHVRTSPFYLQSNGKIERWHKSLRRSTRNTTASWKRPGQQRRESPSEAAGKTKPPSLRTVRLTDEVEHFRKS